MVRTVCRPAVVLFLIHAASVWGAAEAQVLGVFRWQMQPYCNVVTLTVIQQGPAYQLTGNDNLCSAPAFAPATGAATPNPNGTVSLGFDIVLPSGATAHVSANVNLANVSGTWTDADGNTGPFVFNPASVGGSPRPDPTRSVLITSAQLAASIFAGTGSATTVARSDHTHDDRYLTEAETVAAIANAGAAVVESTAVVPPLTLDVVVVQQVVTTPTAGRLLVNMPIGISSVDCVSTTAYYAFLTIDDTAIPNSTVLTTEASSVPQLIGVTTAVVPAGAHTIRGGIRCSTGSWSFVGHSSTIRVSAIVLP